MQFRFPARDKPCIHERIVVGNAVLPLPSDSEVFDGKEENYWEEHKTFLKIDF
jgi:hypothetical protein